MTFKRPSGRDTAELREIDAKVGVVKRADGSAMFRIGKTVAIAAVYGPRNLYPKFLQNPEKGILRCHYNMMAFSGSGERVRPGPSRRSKEISLVTAKALEPVIDLSDFPYSVVDIFIELIQTDAGTRCAGICAAAMALADAGIPMKDMVAAVSFGEVDGHLVVDLDKEEEDFEGPVADIPVAMTQRTKEITLLQMDGQISEKRLGEGLKLTQEALGKIFEVQKKALLEKYGVKNG